MAVRVEARRAGHGAERVVQVEPYFAGVPGQIEQLGVVLLF